MKQRISTEDLKSLTPSQQEKLRAWWEPQDGDYIWNEKQKRMITLGNGTRYDYDDNSFTQFYWDELQSADLMPVSECLPLLSIGQCIELLEITYAQLADILKELHFDEKQPELIDALWEAVKSIF